MRLISQHGQLDGSTGRDNRQINCPLRASEQYKAVYVPGKSRFDLRRDARIKNSAHNQCFTERCRSQPTQPSGADYRPGTAEARTSGPESPKRDAR
jgi:hypothetical protein